MPVGQRAISGRRNRRRRRKPEADLREVLNAIRYMTRTGGGMYDLRTTQHVNDPTTAKNRVAKFYKNGNRKFAHEESRKIHAYGEHGGWVHLVRTSDIGLTCIFAMVGFLSDPAKPHSHITDEHYDTSVDFHDCSADRSLDEVVAFLKGLKIVPPGYNRSVAGS